MKMLQNKFLILYFFIFLQPTLSAMEMVLIPINDPYPIENIVDLIDTAINTKYSKNIVADFFTQSLLTEDQLLDIINILTQNCSTITHDLITALSEKNTFIAIAVKHFFHYARKNLDSVTIDTLQTVQDPGAEQSTAELNVLPFLFKKYIMKNAFDTIKHSYIIPLKYDNYIRSIDICPSEDLLAASTLHQTGSNITVWDLKTGKRAQEITTPAAVASVCFNGTGSHLAASTGYQNKYYIKIWNPIAGTELYTIPVRSNIIHLGYMNNAGDHKNVLLCHRSGGEDKHIIIDEWSLTTQEPRHKRSCDILAQYYMPFRYYARGNYQIADPLQALRQTNTLEVKKKNCNHLYVLEKAIFNSTTANALQKLDRLPLFQHLTEYEKNKLEEMYIKKGTQ